MSKFFVTPDSLRIDSFKLGSLVLSDGFKPDFIVSLFRGGAFTGCCVNELFNYKGIKNDCISIRTSRYTGIDQTNSTVQVHNLGYLTERINKTSKILLVDDVFDTGITIEAVFNALKEKTGDNFPDDIRVATVYFKPERNKTERIPEYYVHKSNVWLVFPHEIEGLTSEEIYSALGQEIGDIIKDTN